MLFLTVVTIVALAVAVVSLQNGQAAPVSFLVWQFQAPVAVIILASTAAGLVIGGLISLGRAMRRWSQRPPGPQTRDEDRPHTDDASRTTPDHRVRSRTLP
jgi:hypothetical protein